MKKVVMLFISIAASKVITPVVVSLLIILYAVIAFGTGEPLITLMELIRRNFALQGLILLVPFNCLAALLHEGARYIARLKVLRGASGEIPPGIFKDEVRLDCSGPSDKIAPLLSSSGYRTKRTDERLSAWRGIPLSPVRMLSLAAISLLALGILLSLTTRKVQKVTIIEGEPLPPVMGQGTVERITLKNANGYFLSRIITVDAIVNNGKVSFATFPPFRLRESFVYMRYLGMAPQVRFKSPDMAAQFSSYFVLMIYPPGREDSFDVTGTPYNISLSLESLGKGDDPYESANGLFRFNLRKGGKTLFPGTAVAGENYHEGGFELSFSDLRRVVYADIVADRGVMLITWGSVLLFVSLLTMVSIRLLYPRREMILVLKNDKLICFSNAEGRVRAHSGLFHKLLDIIDSSAGKPS